MAFEIIENISLPENSTLIEAKEFYTSWLETDDTKTQRAVFEVNGHNVQIVRYDFSPNVNIMIDGGRIEIVEPEKIDQYISRNTR